MSVDKAFHAALLLYYAVVNHYIFDGIRNPHHRLGRSSDDALVNRMLSGCPTYFTGWNLTIQESYFFLRLVEHLLELLPFAQPECLRRWTRMVLSIILVPGSCAVVFMFWSVYAVNPSLVFGDFLDVINPTWVNHAIHTNVAPIAILELFLRARSDGIWDGGFLRGAVILTAFLAFYLITISVALLVNGFWPYPLLDPIDRYTFLPFCLVIYLVFGFWYSVSFYMGRKLQEKPSAKRSKKMMKKSH